MPKTIIDPKGTITNGMVPNWEVNEKGQVYAWNGARPLNNLDHFTKVAPPIVDVVADPSGNGVIMFGNDKRQDPDGEWRRSTYTILVGM